MIFGYVEREELELAVKFLRWQFVKCVVAWIAMISGYIKFGKIENAKRLYGVEDGLKLFRMMLRYGIRPNHSSLSIVKLGCSELSALQLGKQVHQLVCMSLLRYDTTAGTSLNSMYRKRGVLDDIWKFLCFNIKTLKM